MLDTVYSSFNTLISSISHRMSRNMFRLSPLQWFSLLLSFQYAVGAWLYLHCFRRTSARDCLGSVSEVLLIKDHISGYIDSWCVLTKQSVTLGMSWVVNQEEFHCLLVKLLPLCIWHMCVLHTPKCFQVWILWFFSLQTSRSVLLPLTADVGVRFLMHAAHSTPSAENLSARSVRTIIAQANSNRVLFIRFQTSFCSGE